MQLQMLLLTNQISLPNIHGGVHLLVGFQVFVGELKGAVLGESRVDMGTHQCFRESWNHCRASSEM